MVCSGQLIYVFCYCVPLRPLTNSAPALNLKLSLSLTLNLTWNLTWSLSLPLEEVNITVMTYGLYARWQPKYHSILFSMRYIHGVYARGIFIGDWQGVYSWGICKGYIHGVHSWSICKGYTAYHGRVLCAHLSNFPSCTAWTLPHPNKRVYNRKVVAINRVTDWRCMQSQPVLSGRGAVQAQQCMHFQWMCPFDSEAELTDF